MEEPAVKKRDKQCSERGRRKGRVIKALVESYLLKKSEALRGKKKKTRRSATLSTKNFTRAKLRLNPGLRGGRPATNRPRHGTASLSPSFFLRHTEREKSRRRKRKETKY